MHCLLNITIEGNEWWHTHVLFKRYFSEVFGFSSCIFLCQMFQLPSSSLVAALHIVYNEILFCSLMWTLIYIQWVTVLCKWRNYSYTFLKEILKLVSLLFYCSQFVNVWVLQSITPQNYCSSVQWTTFWSDFIDHDAAHKYAEKILLLWVWVERRSMGKLTSFLKKGSSKNCIIVKILFFSFLLQTFSENMGQKFSFSFR